MEIEYKKNIIGEKYMTDKLMVKINSPEKVLWEGEAEWVSSVNSQGPFDILPFHTNFVTIIEDQKIRINTGKEITEYTFTHSVIYAHSNHVYIYTNI
jgi:F0F1-type ATP synthase epsilon subunit